MITLANQTILKTREEEINKRAGGIVTRAAERGRGVWRSGSGDATLLNCGRKLT